MSLIFTSSLNNMQQMILNFYIIRQTKYSRLAAENNLFHNEFIITITYRYNRNVNHVDRDRSKK